MINNSDAMRELYQRKRNSRKEALRIPVQRMAMLNRVKLSEDELWKRFTSKGAHELQKELVLMQQEMGLEGGNKEFSRMLDDMEQIAGKRTDEDKQFVESVKGQFRMQINRV